MTTKEFNNLEEMQKYYVEKTNTYVFKENDEYIDLVKFNFDLDINSDIEAQDIIAYDINAKDIYANDINARNIKANNISYYSVCFAGEDIKCKSIKGRRENAKHFTLDGVLEVKYDRKTNE